MTEPPARVPVETIAAVAVGGALGSAARYGLAILIPTTPGGLPWATLITNLVGCALLGALMAAIEARIAPHRLLRPFLGTGLLGGFTTFSAYALETRELVDTGHVGLAVSYLLGTLIGALAAVRLGMWAVDRVLRR